MSVFSFKDILQLKIRFDDSLQNIYLMLISMFITKSTYLCCKILMLEKGTLIIYSEHIVYVPLDNISSFLLVIKLFYFAKLLVFFYL